MDRLSIVILLGATFIDRVLRSINPAEKKIDPQHSPPVPISKIHKARAASKKEEDFDALHSVIENLALLKRPTEIEPIPNLVAGQVVSKNIREISVLVSTKATGMIKVFIRNNVAKRPAYMTAKGLMDVHPRCSS